MTNTPGDYDKKCMKRKFSADDSMSLSKAIKDL